MSGIQLNSQAENFPQSLVNILVVIFKSKNEDKSICIFRTMRGAGAVTQY
jgi:hypothetical protein